MALTHAKCEGPGWAHSKPLPRLEAPPTLTLPATCEGHVPGDVPGPQSFLGRSMSPWVMGLGPFAGTLVFV